MIARLKWFISQPPLHVLVFIVGMSLLAATLPSPWKERLRFFNGFTMLSLLLWGFFRGGQEARKLREELREHRAELLEMFQHRSKDLQAIKDNAFQLSADTARIAAALAAETKAHFDAVVEKVVEGTNASKEASEHANSANEKILAVSETVANLNKRLLAQEKNEKPKGKP